MKRVLLSRRSQIFGLPPFLTAAIFCLYSCSKKVEQDVVDVKKDIIMGQPTSTSPVSENSESNPQTEQIQNPLKVEEPERMSRPLESMANSRRARASKVYHSSQKQITETSTEAVSLIPAVKDIQPETLDKSESRVNPNLVSEPDLSMGPVSNKIAILNFWLGLGFNYFHFNQSSQVDTESGDFSSQSLNVLSCGAGVDFSEKSGVDFQYHQSSGKIPTQADTPIDTNEFTRKTMAIQFQQAVFERGSGRYFLRLGLVDHQLPMLSTDLNNGLVNVLDIELMNATVGVRYLYKASDRLEYELLLNYQQLLSGKSMNGYQLHISPRLMFDGSVGVLRRFPSGFRVGLYWYGQSVDFDYDQTRAGTQSVGSEKLFDSTVQVRFGWDIF